MRNAININIDRKKKILIFVILIAFVIGSTVFILRNSLMDHASSHSTSGVITEIVTDTEDEEEWGRVDLIVRKFAHIIEYAFLGACIAAFCTFLDCIYSKRLYGYFIAYSLFIAVLDEHFQGLSDRASSTSDILLDFVGSLFGFAFIIVLFSIILYLIKKKKSKMLNRLD